MKKLAVLMPTYNCAGYLRESIDSILNQTYANFDFYIYDDCSTDETQSLIESYNDSRIIYIKNSKNLGIAATLNLGLEKLLPHYKFIARMDADDWSFPERFQKQIDFMEANPEVAMSGTQAYWLDDMSSYKEVNWLQPGTYESIKLYLLFTASFGHQTIIFRSEYISKLFRYDTNIKTCEDWDLWTKIVLRNKIVNLPDFLVKVRILPTSNHRSAKNKVIHLKERAVIISKHWKNFNIVLTPQEVFEYYYDMDCNIRLGFYKKLNKLIDSFNILFLNHAQNLDKVDKMRFSYMLSRRVLDFWKRSGKSRINVKIWIFLFTRVRFINKFRLIKSQIN